MPSDALLLDEGGCLGGFVFLLLSDLGVGHDRVVFVEVDLDEIGRCSFVLLSEQCRCDV